MIHSTLRFCVLFGLAILCTLGSSAFAQQQADTSGKIKFYLTCETCDMDFVRKEITYVDYVRDAAQSDVECFVVSENTANGGNRHTFVFIGRGKFAGLTDTLRVSEKESDTPEDLRGWIVHLLSLGLARYVAHSPQGDAITIAYKSSDSTTQTAQDDPYNSWVFSTEINSYVSGEQLTSMLNFWGTLSANRITPDSKTQLSSTGTYVENHYKDLDLISIARSYSFNGLWVKSLGQHWSAGPSLDITNSTFSNTNLRVDAAAGVEYDIFPYEESTSRQFRLLYKLGISDIDYIEETIFDRTHERLGFQRLSASVVFEQPWGSIETTVTGSEFLHDFSQNRLTVFANLQLRLTEGLSLRILGNAALIHDQISLPKAGATEDEILLQRQQLATDYNYFSSVGFVYTFGSIYNNVVNPRFGN